MGLDDSESGALPPVVEVVETLFVGFRDVGEPIDEFEGLGETLVGLLRKGLMHVCKDLQGLGQGFVAFGELFEAFVDSHIWLPISIILSLSETVEPSVLRTDHDTPFGDGG